MKKDIAEFVTQCPKCQQVKIEHQKPGGLLHVIEIPTWKREVINVDFIAGFPVRLSVVAAYIVHMPFSVLSLPFLIPNSQVIHEWSFEVLSSAVFLAYLNVLYETELLC
ncbi:PREDICTED: uncharacterized protein LOC109221323, partial [Nicotiana attenuata]|uniref:uncharacterized protein LOC109221323 n=1 Tax=Nicotiana attenuata TaxID=49451 RepID=UPI000905933E